MEWLICLGLTFIGFLIALVGVFHSHSTGMIVVGFGLMAIGIIFRPRSGR
jgi:hypothetical protein